MPSIIVNIINIILRKELESDADPEVRELTDKVYNLEDRALAAERRLAEFEAQLLSRAGNAEYK